MGSGDGRGHVHVRVLRRSGVQLDAHDHHHEEHACDAKTLFPNGTYYWRVRANSSTGVLGDWSEVRDLDVEWAANPDLLAPADGATITYPSEALELKWDVVPGASKYDVKVATDPELASLLWDGDPIETAATQFSLSKPLAPGTYYWGIVPRTPRATRASRPRFGPSSGSGRPRPIRT